MLLSKESKLLESLLAAALISVEKVQMMTTVSDVKVVDVDTMVINIILRQGRCWLETFCSVKCFSVPNS